MPKLTSVLNLTLQATDGKDDGGIADISNDDSAGSSLTALTGEECRQAA